MERWGAVDMPHCSAEKVSPGGLVIALDRDPQAVTAVRDRFVGLPVKLFTASYVELPALLRSISIDAVAAILLDLGLSSDQLADPARASAFKAPEIWICDSIRGRVRRPGSYYSD